MKNTYATVPTPPSAEPESESKSEKRKSAGDSKTAPEPLEDMTIRDLIGEANKRKVEVPTNGRKAEIISALRDAGVRDPK